jgi:hypothetical protein
MHPTNGAARALSLGRAAEAMLRALGGGEVRLRLPLNLAAAEPQRAALGLDGPAVEEVALAPVVVRAVTAAGEARFELLLPATRLQALAAERGLKAEALLQRALGFVQGDRLLRVAHFTAETFAGLPYLYRVTATE